MLKKQPRTTHRSPGFDQLNNTTEKSIISKKKARGVERRNLVM